MRKYLKRVYSSAVAIFIAAALVAQHAQSAEQRTIVVDPAQASLSFEFRPVKPEFDYREALEFTLEANQDVFLYIYTVTAEGDYALILPNNMQTQNKYPANTVMQLSLIHI